MAAFLSSYLQDGLLEIKNLQALLMKMKNNLPSPTKHSQENSIPLLDKSATEGCPLAKKYAEGLKTYKRTVYQLIYLAAYIGNINLEELDSETINTICRLQNNLVIDVANIFKIDLNLPQWSSHMQRCLKLITFMVLKKQGQSTISPVDKSARICHLSLTLKTKSSDLKQSLEFVEKSIEKYPEEPFFFFVKGSVLGAMKNFDLSVDISTSALRMFPNNLDLLYNTAAFLKHSMRSTFESRITAWNEYLKYAHVSDPHVPEFYYEIGCASILNMIGQKDNDYGFTSQGGCKELVRGINLSKRAYYNGLKAETHILPCSFVDAENREYTARLKAGLPEMIKIVEATRNENKNEDPEVQTIIKEHRRMVHMNSKLQKSEECLELQRILYTKCSILTGMQPSIDQVSTAVDADTLQPILINDMKTCGVYENRMVQLMSIEPALIFNIAEISDTPGAHGSFVSLVVKDGKGYVMQVHIINYNHAKISPEGKSLQGILGVGCKLSIKNPLVQSFVIFSEDVKLMIIVDDPSSIVLHLQERAHRLCQYCLVEYGPLYCSKCKKAYYCDDFCQNKDYQDFGHEMICSVGGQLSVP